MDRSDFKADFKKDRFKILSDAFKGKVWSCVLTYTSEWLCTFDYMRGTKELINKRHKGGYSNISFRKIQDVLPNKFYYVVPENLIKLSECPDFAGLIYVNENGIKEVKRAPVLHKNKHSKDRLFNKCYQSYLASIYYQLITNQPKT